MVGLMLVSALLPVCEPERVLICGSIRRKKEMVGDVEILFVPKIFAGRATDFFAAPSNESAADVVLADLLKSGVLAKRRNVNGSEMWGEKNKLAVHVPTGIPVDLFAATQANWFNYLVCRTGPAESNTRIAMAAQRKGWKWNPYGSGFSRGGALAGEREEIEIRSEEEVFAFVGLPFTPPEGRA